METLRSILAPIDGSPPSLAALDHAIALATDYGARLDILHVQPVPPKDAFDPAPPARAEIESAMNAAIEHAMEQLGGRVLFRTSSGDPVREIVEAASGDTDLIVMGTHGRIGRLHALLGSVAEGVVRNAPCPVLTVRDVSGGYQSFAERRHGRPTLAEQAHEAHAPGSHR